MSDLNNKEQFTLFVEDIRSRKDFRPPFAFGLGLGTLSRKGNLLEVFFPEPSVRANDELIAVFSFLTQQIAGNRSYSLTEEQRLAAANLLSSLNKGSFPLTSRLLQQKPSPRQRLIATFLTADSAVTTIEEAYLKLSLLSFRLRKPNELNLDSIFRVLPNVAWTSEGPLDPDDFPEHLLEAKMAGRHIEVFAVDKLPKLLNYHLPSQVRVADGARVRLGAFLGEGTTVMHEGFVNFNAGTEGPNMIEGRISAGVIVGSGSDLGGGSSTMGTLSGGNDVRISVGTHSLIGANAGTGIPLGNNCIIEAGLYLTASTKVEVLNEKGDRVKVIKASELALTNNLLFRRHSQTGAVQALPNKREVKLNTELHKQT